MKPPDSRRPAVTMDDTEGVTDLDRVYIAGCGGMLGRAFYEEFAARADFRCTDIDVNEDWLDYLDFATSSLSRDVRDYEPDYLFHLGALTDLEYCEAHPDEAYATNAIAVENAVFIANELDIPLLYIGTAGSSTAGKRCTTIGMCPTRWAPTRGPSGRARIRGQERAALSDLSRGLDDGRWAARTRSSFRSSWSSCTMGRPN